MNIESTETLSSLLDALSVGYRLLALNHFSLQVEPNEQHPVEWKKEDITKLEEFLLNRGLLSRGPRVPQPGNQDAFDEWTWDTRKQE